MKRQYLFTKALVSALLITCIISTTKAEIPFIEAQGIYAATKDEYKHISPFWGMVAVHGRLLERIRFYGFYEKNYNGSDRALDRIAELISRLFPSPDGVQFVANNRDKDSVGDLSRDLKSSGVGIDNIIQVLLSNKNDLDKVQEITTLLGNLKVKSNTKLQDQQEFAQLLVEAYMQQDNYANLKNSAGRRYPDNIVIISLLSFVVKVADNKTQLLNSLPSLFVPNSNIDTIPPYTRQNYFDYKKDILQNPSLIPTNIQDPSGTGLAWALFMAKGFEVYERLIVEPLNYRSDTHFNPKADAFSDCGETSLRNFFMLLLSVGNNGIVHPSNLQSLEDSIKFHNSGISLDTHTPYTKFRDFILAHPDITNGATKDIHDAWAQVVSNLNEGKAVANINDVQYGRRSNKKKKIEDYEIKSNFSKIGAISIINMFNVIARIIPDQKLNESWDNDQGKRYKQVEEKLGRLCELFSRNNMRVSWKNASTDTPEINSDFMTIIFMIDGGSAFTWQFKDGHFQIDRFSDGQDDWRTQFSYYDTYPNEWMASLFPRSSDIQQEKAYVYHFPMVVIYNPSLRTPEGVMKTIPIVLDMKMENFYSLINYWIHRSVPLNNEFFLSKIIDFLAKYLFDQLTDGEIKNMIDANIANVMYIATQQGMLQKNIVALALKDNQLNAAKIFIHHKANPDMPDTNGNTPLCLAVLGNNIEIIDMLIHSGAEINTPGKNRYTPLHFAVLQKNNMDMLDRLIKAGANVNASSNSGSTPLHLAVSINRIDIINILIDKGAKLELCDSNHYTPLHLAAVNGNLEVVNVLIQFNANVNTKGINGATPLISIAAKNDITDKRTKKNEEPKYIQVMETLINAGAKINAQDEWDKTCLDFAEDNGYEAIVEFLKSKGAKKGDD